MILYLFCFLLSRSAVWLSLYFCREAVSNVRPTWAVLWDKTINRIGRKKKHFCSTELFFPDLSRAFFCLRILDSELKNIGVGNNSWTVHNIYKCDDCSTELQVAMIQPDFDTGHLTDNWLKQLHLVLWQWGSSIKLNSVFSVWSNIRILSHASAACQEAT